MLKEKKQRRPTTKQELFARGIAQGMMIKEAGLAAGYSPASVNSTLYTEMQENTRLQQLIEVEKENFAAALERAGATDDVLATGLVAQMNATKMVTLPIIDEKGNKIGRKTVEVPDHAARLQAIELIMRAKGYLNEPEEPPQTESYEARIKRLRGV